MTSRYPATSNMLLVFALALAACGSRTETPPGAGGGGTPPASPGATPAPAAPTPTPTTQATGTGSVVTRAPAPATGCPATDVAARALPGTVHSGATSVNETWDLAGSPHHFPSGLHIMQNAIVTVEPCALVVFGDGQDLVVENGGTLIANGEETRPITFDSGAPEATPTPGAWGGLHFQDGARDASKLRWINVLDAGGETGWGVDAAIWAAGEVTLDAQHVRVEHAKLSGFSLRGHARFSSNSAALVVTHTGVDDPYSAPVVFEDASRVGSLPEGQYTGNFRDEICVTQGEIRTTATWRNPGVRYRIDQRLDVKSSSGAILTIAPGTTLAFSDDAGLLIGYGEPGGIVLDGGSDATRIVLTSLSTAPDPGAWQGILLGENLMRGASRLAWVTIRFAGKDATYGGATCGGSAQAAIVIQGQDFGPKITHVKFESLPPEAFAVLRSYHSAAPTDYAAAATGNDFAQAGVQCRQNVVPAADGACPETPTCH